MSEEAKALARTAGVRRLDAVVLGVSGDDVRSWLQGQVTNDIGSSKAGDATYALVTTAKGRIVGDLWVLDRGDDGFWLVVPAAAAEGVHAQLDGQIIMEDVELIPTDRAVITVQGPAAPKVTKDAEPGGVSFAVDRLGNGGIDVIISPDDTAAALASLVSASEAAGGGEVDDAAWELARVRAAMPRFGVDFDEKSYPQEAGLDAAVSFTKGCYVGQEVVCRLEMRGKLTRRLVSLRLANTTSPPPRDTPIQDANGPVGVVRTAVLDPTTDSVRALGYVKRLALQENRPLQIDGQPATLEKVVGET